MAEEDPWADYVTPAVPAPGADPWADFTTGAPTTEPTARITVRPPDKYREAAIADRQRIIDAAGEGLLNEGLTSRLTQGLGMGWTDDVMAAGATPLEMIRRGTLDPREGYRYARAFQDLTAEERAKKTAGLAGGTMEVLGGLTTGAGVLGAGTRAVAGRLPAWVKNTARNVTGAGTLGAIQGAGDAPTLAEVAPNAAMGGIIGGTVGAVVPPLAAGVGKAVRGTAQALQLTRLRNADQVATEQIAETARNAGVSPQEIVRQVTNANAAGQPYTIADALGHEGRRKLAGLAKTPGAQRERIIETLTARDLNMPIRTGSQVGRALGAPTTAEAASEALTQRAAREASPLYRAAEEVPTWSPRLQEFIDDPIARAGLRHGVELQRLRSVGSDRPFNPRDAMITDFNAAGDPIITGVPNMQTLHTLKVGLDRMIESNINPATGRLNARGNAIAGFQRRMLDEIDRRNPTYAEARRTYAGPMQQAAAVRVGEEMPSRGLAEDTLRTFSRLSPNQQEAARIGYATAVREPLERTGNYPGILRDKSIKGTQELEALSTYQGPRRPGEPDPLRQFLTREQEMAKTSKAAVGGSATAENLADMAAGPGAENVMGLLSSAARGQPMSALQNVWNIAKSYGRGESEAQRVRIAQALLAREPRELERIARNLEEHELRRRGVNPFVDRPPRYAPGE